jgi:hypothetical protein
MDGHAINFNTYSNQFLTCDKIGILKYMNSYNI